jgi:hypothetical protein
MSSNAASVTFELQSSGGRNLIRVVIWEPGASRNTDAAKAILSGNNPSQNVQIFSNAPSLVNASRNNAGNIFDVPINVDCIKNKLCCQNSWSLNIMGDFDAYRPFLHSWPDLSPATVPPIMIRLQPPSDPHNERADCKHVFGRRAGGFRRLPSLLQTLVDRPARFTPPQRSHYSTRALRSNSCVTATFGPTRCYLQSRPPD